MKILMSNRNPLRQFIPELFAVCFLLVLVLCGCESPPPAFDMIQGGMGFPPASVRFGGLTQILRDKDTKAPKTLRVFIELRDQFDSKLKIPFTLRLELYRYAPYSSNPKGTHLKRWPDFVLTEANINNLYWRDYLRSYEFLLELDDSIPKEEPLLAAATCWTSAGVRLETVYVLTMD